MSLIRQLENDAAFGHDIMRAAGIRTFEKHFDKALPITVLTWFSHGRQIGPVFGVLEQGPRIQLIWPYRIKEPRIYQSTLKKALPVIKATNHIGVVAIRCIIDAATGKAHGVSWITTITPELSKAIEPLLKVSFDEWMEWLEHGNLSEWINGEFNYVYSGRVIDTIADANQWLFMLKQLGYELPINSVDPMTQAVAALASPTCECDHLRQP